jgi:Thioredoxin
MDFKQLWQQALPFDDYVKAAAPEHRPLWDGVYRLARVPDWALAPVAAGDARHLLVLAEDWCGDAVNTVPVLARWAQRTPGVSLRILRRDEHPDVMDRYLTNGARSIPVVIALDRDFVELGAWGPRPRELQAWVMAHKDTMPKDERYREVRRWYARDKGETTIREVMEAMGAAVKVAG